MEHPYFLLLLLFFPLYFYFRNVVKYYFRHACLENLSNKIVKTQFKWQHLILVGAFFLIIAACSIIRESKELAKVYAVHKYVLVNDGSGSMVNNSKENGIGNELIAVLAGNDILLNFLGKRKDGSKDLVSAIIFSDDAFIVSGLSDDPKFVQKKLKRVDYRMPPLSSGTNIEAGLWGGLEMLLSNNDLVKQEELDHLQFKFYGKGPLKTDDAVEAIVARKSNFVGNSIIIFTDGFFNAEGDRNKMSSFKIIDFCKLIGVRVYFISIGSLNETLIKSCKNTGGRGDVIQGYDRKAIERIYEEIVTSQANEYVLREVAVDHSLSDLFSVFGIVLVYLGLIFRNTVYLNYTEV